jgi:hypothetical protein
MGAVMADLELESMARLSDALEPLSDEQRRRVMLWAFDKFQIPHSSAPKQVAQGDSHVPANPGEFEDLASLFEACDPKTDREKALVAGYWLQNSANGKEWDTENANEQLKELGHGIKNISLAIHGLKPKFVLQTKTQGADGKKRKQYRLTTLGLKKVRDMMLDKPQDEHETA